MLSQYPDLSLVSGLTPRSRRGHYNRGSWPRYYEEVSFSLNVLILVSFWRDRLCDARFQSCVVL